MSLRNEFFSFLFLCSCLISISANAASGKSGSSFLEIPIGAAPAAMGSAYSALATDAYAPVWNPAGLGFLKEVQVAGQHLTYLDALHDEFVSAVVPIHPGMGLGVSVQYLGSGDVNSFDASGASIGTFSSHYGAYALAYGQAFGPLSIGGAAKYIQAAIADVHASAWGFDIGALYKVQDHLFLSAVADNVGTSLRFIDQPDALPLAYHVGLAYEWTAQWVFSTEGVFRRSGPAGWHGGVEWNPINLFSVRAGYRTDTTQQLSAVAGVSAGVGLHLWNQEFDYAWVPYGDLGTSQYFSLVLRFGDAGLDHNLTGSETHHD